MRIKKNQVIAALVAATLLSQVFVLPDFQLLLLASWAIFGVLALSLDLVWGIGGILSFGQISFYGLSAYVYGVLAINYVDAAHNTLIFLVAAALTGALTSAVLGYFLFYSRIGDVQVTIITFTVNLVLLAVSTNLQVEVGEAVIGGLNGMTGIPSLVVGLPGTGTVQLNPQGFYAVVVVICLFAFWVTYVLARSSFGRVINGVRVNPIRAELLGYDIRALRLAVFSIGGAIAGLAGGLHAAWANFMSPDVFGLASGVLVPIWVLVGGRGTLVGAFLGALTVSALSYFLGGTAGAGQVTLTLGVLLLVGVLFMPAGLLSLAVRGWTAIRALAGRRETPKVAEATERGQARWTAAASEAPGRAGEQAKGLRLETKDVSKAFGGVRAVDGITLTFEGLLCLIGPNGAGKSTFFSLLVGRNRPDAGCVLIDGKDITSWQPHRRMRAGIGIKLQATAVFPELPTRENLWLASFARLKDRSAAEAAADELLGRFGLSHASDQLAGSLSHGEQQWLEIAMVIASAPKIVLLDEPTAGMTREETARTANLVQQLATNSTVVVVEHDMEFVRMLASPVIVLHQGKVFATGRVEDLRRDERILRIYLGEGGPC